MTTKHDYTKPHGHPKFSENQDKLEARNHRNMYTPGKHGGDPCVFCGCGVKGPETVGVFYGPKTRFATTDDTREPDIEMGVGADCLRKIKKVVPNLKVWVIR